MDTSDNNVKLEIDRLNKQFYKSFDTEYFLQKCIYLVGILNKPQIISESLTSGAKFKSLNIEWKDSDDEKDILAEDRLKRNLKSEISTTYFHAIETLFRIIFAHANNNGSPWVELTVRTSFKHFKSDVEKFAEQTYFKGDHLDGISLVFYGRHAKDKPSQLDQEAWDKTLKNITEYLEFFAGDLANSYAYNSYKHGLAMFNEEFGFSLGDFIKVEKDDAMVFLSFSDDKENKGYKQLHTNHTFMKWEKKFALVYQLTALLKNVINVGNWQYNGGSYEVQVFDKLDLMSIIHEKDNPFQPSTMSMSSFSFKMKRRK